MRKVFAVILVIVLVFCSVIPCFASSGTGNETGHIDYSTVPFDRFQINGTYDMVNQASLPWIFRDTRKDSGAIRIDAEQGYVSLEVSEGTRIDPGDGIADYYIDGHISAYMGEVYDGLTIYRLEADQMYLGDDAHCQLTFNDNGHTVFTQVIITAKLEYIYKGTGSFYIGREDIIYDSNNDTEFRVTNSVDVGQMMYDLLDDEKYNGDQRARLTNVVVSLAVHTNTPGFKTMEVLTKVEWRRSYTWDNYFAQWFIDQNLYFGGSGVNGSVDYVSWLTTAVESAVTLEIAPGFSLDTLFYLIILITVVLWLIKIIR